MLRSPLTLKVKKNTKEYFLFFFFSSFYLILVFNTLMLSSFTKAFSILVDVKCKCYIFKRVDPRVRKASLGAIHF